MTFPEQKKDKVYYDNIPYQILNRFNKTKKGYFHHIRYNPHKKILILQKNKDCQFVINNIKKMYYDDDSFIIQSELYIILLWNETKKWQIINRV